MSTTTIDPHPLLEDLEASSMTSSFITKSKSYMGSVMEYAPSTHLWQKILIGGTLFDAFMMESAQQVGQSLLNLPRIFAKSEYIYNVDIVCVYLVMSLSPLLLIIYLFSSGLCMGNCWCGGYLYPLHVVSVSPGFSSSRV